MSSRAKTFLTFVLAGAALVGLTRVGVVRAVIGPGVTTLLNPLGAAGVSGPIPTTIVANPDQTFRDLQRAKSELAWKSALRVFLTQFAQDAANIISSGGPGQGPLYETRDVGDALLGAADAALGEYASSLTSGPLGLQLGLSPDLRRRIGLGITPVAPAVPQQTFSQILSQLDPTNQDYLGQLQNAAFSGGDLGAGLSALIGAQEVQQRAIQEQQLRMQISQFLPVYRNLVKRDIATPPAVVEELQRELVRLDNLAKDTLTHTGNPIADALNVFATTLLNNMLQKIRLGLFKPSKVQPQTVRQFSAAPAAVEGVRGAQSRFADLVAPAFSPGGAREILRDLATCANPITPGPNTCVIDDGFRLAVESQMTLRDALERGNLRANAPVGFRADGLEPSFKEGYPYRSLIILRKHRIIPVGWELAALLVKLEEPGRVRTLKDFVDAYNNPTSPFYRLVDPDWVLKAPENFCRRKGPGPVLLSDSITPGIDTNRNASFSDPDDVPPRRVFARADEYCADDTSCLATNPDGTCRAYGYCTLERRTWTMLGSRCEPLYNSCLTFDRSDGSRVSYLGNTLDFGQCRLTSAGCKAFSTKKNEDGKWSGAVSDQLFLNERAERCEPSAAGCRRFLAFAPSGGRSLAEGLRSVLESPEQIPDLSAYEREGTVAGLALKIDPVKDACPKEFVGCDRWSAVGRANTSLTAVVEALDRCPRECAGFVTYVSDQTSFEDSRAANFIAATARQCTATDAGCDEFTNLDAVERGGEALDYYSQLRRCRKPEAGRTQLYYNWQSAESEGGIQLVSWELERCNNGEMGCSTLYEASTNNGPNAPRTVDRSGSCKSDFLRGADVDCREFLFVPSGGDAKNPERYYRRLSKVIFASEDCHPFRRTILSSGTECERESGIWTASATDSTVGSCVYQGIPGQGRQCRKEIAGCRLHRGPGSGDVRWVFHDDFEKLESFHCPSSASNCWNDGVAGGDFQRVASGIVPGRFSMRFSQNISVYLPEVSPGGRAVVQLLGRADRVGTIVKVSFGAEQTSIRLSNDFESYLAGPVLLGSENRELATTDTTNPRRLTLSVEPPSGSSSATVFLDDLVVSEVPDTVAVVSGTHRTPARCSTDTLGCWPYRSASTNAVETMKSFGRSCEAKFIGCSELIDTRNTMSPYPSAPYPVRSSAEPRTLVVPEDRIVTVVRRPNQSCTDSEIGCQLMGSEQLGADGKRTTVDVAMKNTPDRYSGSQGILCNEDEVGCTLYHSESRGDFVFKEPHSLCQYELKEGQTTPGWYKVGSLSATADCPLRSDLTIGVDRAVSQPGRDASRNQWVGMCPEAQSGCTEYLDPRSLPSRNLLFNETLQQDVDANGVPDGWRKETEGSSVVLSQSLALQPKALYVASISAPSSLELRISGCGRLSSPDGSFQDEFGQSAFEESRLSRIKAAEPAVLFSRFRFEEGSSCLVSVVGTSSDLERVRSLGLRQAMASYALDRTVTSGECNGIVDERRGCVLFAKRSIEGGVVRENLVANGSMETDEAPSDGIPDRWEGATVQHVVIRDLGEGVMSRALKSLPGASPLQRIQLTAGTQYRLSFLANGDAAGVGLACDDGGLLSPDGSVRNGDGRPLAASDKGVLLLGERVVASHQRGLFIARRALRCSLALRTSGSSAWVDDVVLQEESPEGRLNRTPPLLYSAEESVDGRTPARCDRANQSCVAAANTVLRARPDRECSQWLNCRTAIEVTDETGKKSNRCLDISSCSGLDANGNCNASPLDPDATMLLGATVSPEQARDMTGYSKVGLGRTRAGAGRVLASGALPLARARQVGNVVKVPNGSFEEATAERKPKHWNVGDQAAVWNPGLFEAVNNPLVAQERAVQPFEGRSYLEVHAGAYALSDLLDVFANTSYTMSAAMNTSALQTGWAVATILQFDSDGKLLVDCDGGRAGAESCSFHTLRLARGLEWTPLVWRFTPQNQKTRFIRIRLTAQEFLAQKTRPARNSITGSIFVDALSITPSLEITKTKRCVGGANGGSFCNTNAQCQGGTCQADSSYLAPSCRLYPKSDAAACREADESGVRYRGLEGYCIERDPSDPSICQLWWPVDAIAGSPSGEIETFYKDRAPLYFCSEFQLLETRSGKYESGWSEGSSWFTRGGSSGGPGSCPAGYQSGEVINQKTGGSFFFNRRTRKHFSCVPSGSIRLQTADGAWYDYLPGSPDSIIADTCGSSCAFSTPNFTKTVRGYCMKVTQVVKSDGSNFAWFDRTKGNYTVPFAIDSSGGVVGYTYNYDQAPFGAVTIPAVGDADNPTSWNLQEPLRVREPSSNVARAGAPYSCSSAGGACRSNQVLVYSGKTDDTGVLYPTSGGESCEEQGAARMKRLFLRPFGTWQWQYAGSCRASPEEKRCSLDSPTITYTAADGRSPLRLADAGCIENVDCQAPTEGCLPFVCADGTITCGSGNACSANSAGIDVCQSGLNTGKPCVASCAVGTPSDQTRCSFGTTPGKACTDSSECGASASGRCEVKKVGGNICDGGVRQGESCGSDGDCRSSGLGAQQYVAVNTCSWDFPKALCSGNIRPTQPHFENGRLTDQDYCAVAPTIGEILLNAQRGNPASPVEVRVRQSDYLTLKFSSQVDQNQLPMTGYAIDWGDGSTTSVSGVEIRSRPNIENPHTLFHLYSYYDVLRASTAGELPRDICTPATTDRTGECRLKVKIQIRDKWGWCNSSREQFDANLYGYRGNECVTNPAAWTRFEGTVVVTER